jgi:alpha-methylacyl-CoA racemase
MTAALEDIRVLELGRVPPAELPGMMLADMGADVLKIDSPAGNTAARSPEDQRFEVHSHTNRNKRSMTLNLKASEGREIFLGLAREADVIVEGFRPGVVDRLGIGYERVAELNPRIVYCSLSGFGQSGPDRLRPAHDLNFLALSGALSLWGRPDAPPDIPLNLVADYGGASMHGALAIMFALFARERSGQGQYIDIAYLDTTIALMAATPNLRRLSSSGYLPRAGEGVFSGTYPYYTLYETADRRWLSVACSEPPLWQNFCALLGRPELGRFARQPAHYTRSANAEEAAARQAVQQLIGTRNCNEWEGHFAEADVCVAPVRSISEVLDDSSLRERGLLTDVDHPTQGRVPQFASPMRLSQTPPAIRHAAPTTGEHTSQVLSALGIDAAGIEKLRASGVVD